MLLENKNAVVYGGAGAVGSAIARTFAREGARPTALAELAEIAAFLASSKAAAVTGAVVNLTGGLVAD